MADTDDTRTRRVDDWGFDDVEATGRAAREQADAEVAGAGTGPDADPDGVATPAAAAEDGAARSATPAREPPSAPDAAPATTDRPAAARASGDPAGTRDRAVGPSAAGAVRETPPVRRRFLRRVREAAGGTAATTPAASAPVAPSSPPKPAPPETPAAPAEPALPAEPGGPAPVETPARPAEPRGPGIGGRIRGVAAAVWAATDDPVRKAARTTRPGEPKPSWDQRAKAFVRRHWVAVAFFALWSLILAFPYFGLGPASFVVPHDTSEMNLPRAVWYGAADAQTGIGAWSPMGISGTDRLASGLSRDFDTFLFVLFPGWLAYGLLMWAQRFIAGFFLFRLLRDWRNVSPAAAACVSCAYALFTQPHINMGWPGFALYDGLALPGLPLVLYLLFRCERWRPRYRYPVIALTGVLFALGSHFFLALFCVTAAVLIALIAFPHQSKRFFWAAPLLFAGAWLAGELPVLWAAAANAGGSQRADHALLTLNTQGGVAYSQWLPKFLSDNLLALVLASAAFILAIIRRAWRVLAVAALAGLCLLMVIWAPFLRDSVFAHLGPLSGFRFDRLFVVLPFMALFAGGLGLGLLPRRTPLLGFGMIGSPAKRAAPVGRERPEPAALAAHERTVVAAQVSLGGNGDGKPERLFVLTRSELVEETSGEPHQTGDDDADAAAGASPDPPLLRRRYGVPIQALVGLAILAVIVAQAVGVQRRVAGEMAAGATYATYYGSPDVTALAQRQTPTTPFRVASVNAPLARGVTQTWHPGFAWAYGLETADGYAVLYSQRYQDFWLRVIDAKIGRSDEIKDYFRRWGNRVYLFASRNYLNRPGGIEAARRWNLNLLSLANVRYFVSPIQLRDSDFTLLPSPSRAQQVAWKDLSWWQQITRTWGGEFPGLPLYIYENRRVLPRAFLVARARVFGSGGKALDAMAAATRRELRSTAFLTPQDRMALGLDDEPLAGGGGDETAGGGTGDDASGDSSGAAAGAAAAGATRITKYSADEVQMTVRAEERGIVILTNSYSRYWKAWIDGEPAPVAPVDHTFLGTVVPAGEHEVVFKYQPPYRLPVWQ